MLSPPGLVVGRLLHVPLQRLGSVPMLLGHRLGSLLKGPSPRPASDAPAGRRACWGRAPVRADSRGVRSGI